MNRRSGVLCKEQPGGGNSKGEREQEEFETIHRGRTGGDQTGRDRSVAHFTRSTRFARKHRLCLPHTTTATNDIGRNRVPELHQLTSMLFLVFFIPRVVSLDALLA